MCYISMEASERALQINQKLLSNFKLIFVILAEKQKIFERVVRCEYWSKCNVLYTNGFVSTSSTN